MSTETENAENTESQAQRARRDEETVQSGADSYRGRRLGQKSRKNGAESFSANRADREGRNSTSPCRQGTSGGIVDRLILKIKALIEESENRTADLKVQLEELRQLSQQLHEQEGTK